MATQSSGYSGTPLPRKLGIHEGPRVAVVSAPDGFTRVLGPLPTGVDLRTNARGRCDVVVFFVTRRAERARRFPSFVRSLQTDGGLWVSWPKKTSGVATDLGFDAVQQVDGGARVAGDDRRTRSDAVRLTTYMPRDEDPGEHHERGRNVSHHARGCTGNSADAGDEPQERAQNAHDQEDRGDERS